MSRSEKYTVRIGATVSGAGVFAGVPKPDGRSGADIIGGDAFATLNDLDGTSTGVNVPQKFGSEGPVRAIAIAADSPIESVDITIAGEGGSGNRVRIAPGSPWIGELGEHDRIHVVPVRSIPLLGARYDNVLNGAGASMQLAQWKAETVAWDCTIDQVTPANLAPKVLASPLIPVRLEVFRGDTSGLGSKRVRAPYAADVLWKIIDRGDGAPSSPCLIVITDGRRRVRCIAGQKNGGAASMAVDGIDSYKALESTGALTQVGTLDLPSFDPLMPATALDASDRVPKIFDWSGGNPYFAHRVVITGAIGDSGYLRVQTWDL